MKQVKTVFVSGNFNILHPGHLRLLRFAKDLGDRLVVGVNSDKIGGAAVHINEIDRMEGLKSNSLVDDVILINTSLEEVLTHLKPNIVVKGREYEERFNIEETILGRYGGRLVFSSGEMTLSSADLLRKSLDCNDDIDLLSSLDFCKRHSFSLDSLTSIVGRFNSIKVCVIGDLIVDEYIDCEPLGMSREDPTIAVSPIENTRYIGGAGIVAAHASSLGAKVDFYSVLGVDATAEYAIRELNGFNVNQCCVIDESRPTSLKQRYRAQGKTLLRVSHLSQSAISKKLQQDILERFKLRAKHYDVVVFSDFNYGALPQPLVDKLIAICAKLNIKTIADSQSSSQVGDISRFRGVQVITPTEHEARLSLRNNEDGLVVVAEKLRKETNVNNILLKLGDEGLMLHYHEANGKPKTDKLPAFQRIPADVAGAGDSMLITYGLAHAAGGDFWQSAFLANIAAAIQVGRLGNTPLQTEELLASLNDHIKMDNHNNLRLVYTV